MISKFLCMVGLLGLVMGLAGCDKCGNWEHLNVPSAPHSCHGDPQPN